MDRNNASLQRRQKRSRLRRRRLRRQRASRVLQMETLEPRQLLASVNVDSRSDVYPVAADESGMTLQGNTDFLVQNDWLHGTKINELAGQGNDTLDFSAVDNTDLTFTIRTDGRIAITSAAGNKTLTAEGIENLIGGRRNNAFVFQQDARLKGNLTGGSGAATINELRLQRTATVDFSNVTNSLVEIVGGQVTLITKVTTQDGSSATVTGASNVTLSGANMADTFTVTAGVNTLQGNAGNDTLTGGTGTDTIEGGVGKDVLIGGPGIDVLKGGQDNDTYQFSDAWGHDTVTELPDEGTDTLDFSRVTQGLTFAMGTTAGSSDITISSADGQHNIQNITNVESIIGGTTDNRYLFTDKWLTESHDWTKEKTFVFRIAALPVIVPGSGTPAAAPAPGVELDFSNVTGDLEFEIRENGSVTVVQKVQITGSGGSTGVLRKQKVLATGVTQLVGGRGNNVYKFIGNGSLPQLLNAADQPAGKDNTLDYTLYTGEVFVNFGNLSVRSADNAVADLVVPGVVPQSGVQRITVQDALQDGDFFTLRLGGPETAFRTTRPIPRGASARDVESALEALSTVQDVQVTGDGSAASPYLVKFLSPIAGFDAIETVDVGRLSQASVVATDSNRSQKISYDATGGSFAFRYDGNVSAGDQLAFDADLADVQAALDTLLEDYTDGLTATVQPGTNGVRWQVTFPAGSTDVKALTIESALFKSAPGTPSTYVSAVKVSDGALRRDEQWEVYTSALRGNFRLQLERAGGLPQGSGPVSIDTGTLQTELLPVEGSARGVEEALEKLAGIHDVRVTGRGTDDAPYQITFVSPNVLSTIGVRRVAVVLSPDDTGIPVNDPAIIPGKSATGLGPAAVDVGGSGAPPTGTAANNRRPGAADSLPRGITRVVGGPSRSFIYGAVSSDVAIVGGTGRDVVVGRYETGQAGADYAQILSGGPSDDRVTGADLPNLLTGDDGKDLLYGGEGADSLIGGSGDDDVYGDPGNDRLEGDRGSDYLSGGLGDDQLYGGANADTVVGGPVRICWQADPVVIGTCSPMAGVRILSLTRKPDCLMSTIQPQRLH